MKISNIIWKIILKSVIWLDSLQFVALYTHKNKDICVPLISFNRMYKNIINTLNNPSGESRAMLLFILHVF